MVQVGKDGRALSVRILRHTGYGFAGAATFCALSKRYQPGLDDAGHPIVSDTPVLNVRYVR